MPEVVCLQGGAEFGDACREMDTELLAMTPGPVVVLPAASAPGREFTSTAAEARAYYRSLGAADVLLAPDPREDVDGSLAAVREAGLLVLPGGSPRRLHEVLVGTPLGEAVLGVRLVSGASAGAMLLASHTVLPEEPAHPVVSALGAVDDSLVVPHYTGALRWLDGSQGNTPSLTLGLPECSGVLVAGRSFRAVGARASVVHLGRQQTVLAPGTRWERPA